jgi:8-oxo-dGTP diphosphatase
MNTTPHALLAVSTDVALLTIRNQRLEVLLVADEDDRRRLPGGYTGMDEDLESSALRHLEEQTGIRGVYLEQLFTFGRPDRDPCQRVVSVAYYALVPADRLYPQGTMASRSMAWARIYDLPPLALDHCQLIQLAHQRLAAKLAYSTIALQFMPTHFTLSALQRVYETILGEALDKRNFRKRILAQNCIEATGELSREGSHRPARLYRVKHPGKVRFTK